MEPGDYDVRLAFGEKIIHGHGRRSRFGSAVYCQFFVKAKCHSPGAIPLAVRDGDGEVGLFLHHTPSYSVPCRYAFQLDVNLLINLYHHARRRRILLTEEKVFAVLLECHWRSKVYTQLKGFIV